MSEESWTNKLQWADEKRRGFNQCEEWECSCFESHFRHIDEGKFARECIHCQYEICPACKGEGYWDKKECSECGTSGAIRRRVAQPYEPDFDDDGD